MALNLCWSFTFASICANCARVSRLLLQSAIAAFLTLHPGIAIAADITGGTSTKPADITAAVIAGSDINFTGGYYAVTIPAAGTPGTTTPQRLYNTGDTRYALYDYGSGHFVAESAAAIIYRKTITGTGTLTVTNATDATTNPSTDPYTGQHPFTGGALVFTNSETFWSGSTAPTLIIKPNTTVAFDQGSSSDLGGAFASDATHARNIVNDGYFYQYIKSSSYSNIAYGDIVNTVPGAGVVTWENGGIASNGHKYRGHALGSSGAHIQPNADYGFDNSVNLNDFSFETYGPNYLFGSPAPTSATTYGGVFYNPGIDIQVQSNRNSGIKLFTGLILTPNGNTKKDFAPVADSLLYSYFDHSRGPFSLSIYIQATAQFGNGQAIVNYGNGLNNTAVQGNFTSVFLQTGNFEHAPNSISDTYYLQTLALDYSGTYHDDACLNTWRDYNQATIRAAFAPGNLVIMNPDPANSGKAANDVIVTCPMLAQGIVQVQKNTVLQLGDGTQGNDYNRAVQFSNGASYSGEYSDSSGNGMVLTKLNSPWPALNPQFSQIMNDGKIIVDNVAGALDMTLAWSDANVVRLLQHNELDTISGTGAVEEQGSLPLTLTGVNTYSGGTTIDAGGTLVVGSPNALGSTGGLSSGGRVTNHGTLESTGGNYVIAVPGDFVQ